MYMDSYVNKYVELCLQLQLRIDIIWPFCRNNPKYGLLTITIHNKAFSKQNEATWDLQSHSHRSLSSSSSTGGGKNGEVEEDFSNLKTKTGEEELYFPLHLQTSNFCEEAINKSEKPADEKYEDGGRQKWSHNSEEEDQIREDPAMYQDKADEEEGEEPEDLTSSIERLRRFVFHSHFNRVVLKCLMDTAM